MGCLKLTYRREKGPTFLKVWKNEKSTSEKVGLYDYGARMYDPAIARFMSIDPLAENYAVQSPYVYAANNPIRYTEYNGMNPDDEVKNEEPEIILTETSSSTTSQVNNISYDKESGSYTISETTTITNTSKGKSNNSDGTVTSYSATSTETTNTNTVISSDGRITSSNSTTKTSSSLSSTTINPETGEIIGTATNTNNSTESGNMVGPLAMVAAVTMPDHFPVMDNYEFFMNDLANNPVGDQSGYGVAIQVAMNKKTGTGNFSRISGGGYTNDACWESFSGRGAKDKAQYKRQVDAFGKPVKLDRSKM